MTSARWVVGLSASLAAASLCACSDAPASQARATSPSEDFADVFSADLAGDERRLALGVVGRAAGDRSGAQVVRVYERGRRGPWWRAPPLRESVAPGNSLSVVRARRRSCVGYEGTHGRVLSCVRRSGWRRLPAAGLQETGRLLKLVTVRGQLVAAIRVRSQLRFSRLTGRRWTRVGAALDVAGALASVGETVDRERTIDVVLTQTDGGERTVWSLSNGRLHAGPPLLAAGPGPAPSGPVRLRGRVYVPVVDAGSEPWQMSVYAFDGVGWSLVTGPLNRGSGSAQGDLSLSGRSVWAAWQENEPANGGLFATRVYAEHVAPEIGPARLIWTGRSIGPGSIEVVQGVGASWILYMPAARRGRALTASVARLPLTPGR